MKTPALLLLFASLQSLSAESADFLQLVKDVPLPGKTTRFDYQACDEKYGRLYISHMGDGELIVFNTKNSMVLTSLPGFPMITGVLLVPALDKVYASATMSHEIAVLDTKTATVIKRIPDGRFPDGAAYSPETHRVFVSDESGGSVTVIDAIADAKIGVIPMGGEVGNTQYDPTSRLIYACVQTRNQLVAINPDKQSIIAKYDLKGGKHPHGFYIDSQHNKAYIACQGDAKLIVFDLATHQEEDVLPIGGDPDVLAFDRRLNVLYVACESGVVSIFKCDGKLSKQNDQKVGPNCHTVAVDSLTHKVYFPLKDVNGAPLLRIMMPGNGPVK